MTVQEIKDQLTAKGIDFEATATKDELQDLLNTANLTNGGSNTGDAGKTNVAHLFRNRMARLEVEAFEGVEVGQIITAPMTSFRMSRDTEWYLGTITVANIGSIQVVVGSTNDLTFDQMYGMKGRNLDLVYTGERTITTQEGPKQVPGFSIDAF